jgi:pimeloyl-ACP methyl ester carboxylesterase
VFAVASLTALGAASLGYLLLASRRRGTQGVSSENQHKTGATATFKTPRGEMEYMTAYDETLAQWPVPYQCVDVPTRFGSTHVIVSGPENAPPLVLLHGHSVSSTMWYPNAGELSKEYRTYAIDAIGQPGKSLPTNLPESRGAFAAWLGDVFDGLGIERAHVVGLSYGGWLALNFALAAPGKVQRLVLLDPAASFVPLNMQFFVRGFIPVLIPIRPLTGAALRWFFRKGTDINERFANQFHLGFKHFRAWARVFPSVFSDEELGSLKTPTLLFMGEHEVIYDPGQAVDRATRLVPHLATIWVPNAGHMTSMEQPEMVNDQLLRFLLPEPRSRTEGQGIGKRRRTTPGASKQSVKRGAEYAAQGLPASV